ncbi:MAG: acyl-CoA transferase, partial [Pseudomonadota bacterium]
MNDIFEALDLRPDHAVIGGGQLASRYRVTDLATTVIGAVGVAVADLLNATDLAPRAPAVVADGRLASRWFGFSIAPIGWELPPVWDPLAGDYETTDGWIKIHANIPAHRRAAIRALGAAPERAAFETAIRTQTSDAVETAIVDAGGAAAAMRSRDAWRAHPQGAAVGREPLIAWRAAATSTPHAWRPTVDRPLADLKVL